MWGWVRVVSHLSVLLFTKIIASCYNSSSLTGERKRSEKEMTAVLTVFWRSQESLRFKDGKTLEEYQTLVVLNCNPHTE